MTSEKLHNLSAEIYGLVYRGQGRKAALPLSVTWLRHAAAVIEDCARQVEALERAEQINVHASDALIRIFNDAERWLERSRAANLEATVKALAADNAP